MDKIDFFLKAVSIGTAIVLSNVTLAAAEASTKANKHLNTIEPYPQFEAHFLSAKGLFKPVVVSPKSNKLVNTDSNLTIESVPIISQSTPTPASSENRTNILESAEEPIPNPEILNPNANPLLFPTKPSEVDVDAPQPITLRQALELAIKNNKDIQVSRLNVERSQEELRQARADLYPTFSTSVNVQNARSAGADLSEAAAEAAIEGADPVTAQQLEQQFGSTNESSTSFDGSVSVNYDIYTGGRRGADIRRAKRQLRFNELDLETIVEQTRFDTASDYYQLQNSDAQVEIQRAAVEDAQQTLKDAQLLEQAGLGTRFEVLQAEVELAQAQQDLTTAIANQNIARRQLAETLSLGQQVNLRSADAIEEAGNWNLTLPQSIVLAYKNRAELEQFLLQREINAAQRQIALADIRPQVSVTGSYQLFNGFNDDVDKLGDGYTAAAIVQWQFFDGGAARAIADQEETDIDIAETQFADQRNQVRFEVEQAYYGLEANQENIDTATRGVNLAEESLRLARLRFQAGVGTQTDVINAQTALTQARGDLVSAIIDYNQSYVQLQRAVTNLPDNSLYDLP
ncbi:TolC family protein [Myxosarcina sp. GI1]|uniref:TolC family protein n=1 Tax=Myxosarcina sp. GI1 TaxID=1541065 RepID=UPI0005651A11|nr:TolC family protein [Myxosarcina sp. GI1]